MHRVSDFDTCEDTMSTGNLIQSRREALDMSREELAQKLGTTRMQVWRVEAGKRVLRVDELKTWAKALKAKPSELIAA
ncbi:MAG TPA: helix-turn-helix transcriptional regulator [Casimicrobiaceae bacterium]|nr:helix-turn-helix transcriptional regulator [Casimicrobiaceae bacterium]